MVEIETRVWRRVIRRRRYRPSCTCGVLPGIVTAPSPARLIARGKLGISVWVKGILDKYLYSRPSNRLLQELADQGLRRSPGTIAGGLRQRLPLLEPVREAIRSRQLSEDRWQADETGWRVFVEVEGKAGQGGHLRLHREGLLQLPPPRNRKGGSSRIEHTFLERPAAAAVPTGAGAARRASGAGPEPPRLRFVE